MNLIIIDHPKNSGEWVWNSMAKYVELLEGSGMTAVYHYRNWILCIYCFRVLPLIVSQWCCGK